MVDFSIGTVTTSTGFIVLHRLKNEDGSTFIAPSFFSVLSDAQAFAELFNNVVAIEPIEWEE